ncbi:MULTISPECIES: LPS export ABC transporter periplasmic protein LptC [Flavobacterium]|uniref:LPS export ABC transporter periplasmic protein LptC n=1 Tax=Flavobacterium hankyongi TaxID=1176532 RepID=A0ABP8ZKZ8_9FLAO|nr:LPS export ABC transporter periplasmic protein LptC [Flavobacterium sp. N1846]
MQFALFKIIFRKVMLPVAATLFFISCESNFNEVRKINVTELNPVGEAQDFDLKYTDSGKIKAVLVSPQMLDYSHLDFPYTEFPKGIKVTIYDENGNQSFVTSNYAISYSVSNLIDLRGQVTITTHEGKKLETEQLYYDQKNEWFFTQKNYKFTDKGNVINGEGIDFSKDFKHLDTQKINGVYSL